MKNIPKTSYEGHDFGFTSTITFDPDDAFAEAARAIAQATYESTEAACAFLDSDEGREFGHQVNRRVFSQRITNVAAIALAIRHWMTLRPTARQIDEYELPDGMNLLPALVAFFSIQMELAE